LAQSLLQEGEKINFQNKKKKIIFQGMNRKFLYGGEGEGKVI